MHEKVAGKTGDSRVGDLLDSGPSIFQIFGVVSLVFQACCFLFGLWFFEGTSFTRFEKAFWIVAYEEVLKKLNRRRKLNNFINTLHEGSNMFLSFKQPSYYFEN